MFQQKLTATINIIKIQQAVFVKTSTITMLSLNNKRIQRHRPCGAEYSSMPPKQMRQQSAAEAADLEVAWIMTFRCDQRKVAGALPKFRSFARAYQKSKENTYTYIYMYIKTY